MRKKLAGLALLAAMLLLAVPAQADIIQTQAFGPAIPDFSPVLTFNKYSGNVADLTAIIVDLSLTSTGGLGQVDNESSSVANVHVEFGTSGYLFSSDVLLPFNLINPLTPVKTVTAADFVLQPNDGDGIGVDVGGPDYNQLVGGADTATATGNVLSTTFGMYVGAGTFDITGIIQTYLAVTGASGISQGTTPQNAEGFVRVTYRTAGGVPEPGTMLLVASGLGGLAAWRRRRRRTAA
ncbi:MAG: PEP-CTERM sorting domain-containing protein [Desulfarculus sp.]|nr:MAG: PEP-CTERM sorting domain-containing protein [Desulfarculus sp.]